MIKTNPATAIISGLVKIPMSAGTNWNGSNVEDNKVDIFSGPQNRKKNNVKIKREMTMRILARFNGSHLYME